MFHDAAEALGTTTKLILAVHQEPGGRYTALCIPDHPQDSTISAAALRRDDDGIMRLIVGSRQDEMMADLERAVRRGRRP